MLRKTENENLDIIQIKKYRNNISVNSFRKFRTIKIEQSLKK